LGTNDLSHKRRTARKDLSRSKSTRKPYDKILIVCEGEKTEPSYFKDAVDYYQIHTAKVTGNCDSDPVSVVNYGIKLYELEEQEGSGPFDRVYCVFDRDAHTNYQEALDKLKNQQPKNVFYDFIYSLF